MRSLLDLPPELLLQIYHNLEEANDVFELAASCSTLRGLFKRSSYRMRILQSVICEGKSLTDEFEAAFSRGS